MPSPPASIAAIAKLRMIRSQTARTHSRPRNLLLTLGSPRRHKRTCLTPSQCGSASGGETRRQDRHQRLAARGIARVEARGTRAVEVEHADQRALVVDRHHQLRAALGIAGDMAVEGVDVLDELSLAALGRRAAHTLA